MNMLKTIYLAAILVPAIHWTQEAPTPSQTPTDLLRVIPEEVGWSSERLGEAANYAEEIGFAAFIMAHRGRVLHSWGRTGENFKLHSIRKPVLSALIGLYTTGGVIDLDSTLDELGIDDRRPQLTSEEKKATVRHLLQGRSGVYHPAAGETQGMKDSRPDRGSHPAGEHFSYNNWDFNALGRIFREQTGKDIFQDFADKIATPIGMQDFDPENCEYQFSPSSLHPKYAFRMSARDLLRFGILFQQRGLWNGNQVIPEGWIDESTSSEFGPNDPASGAEWGYMWGLMTEGTPLAETLGGPGLFFSGVGGHTLVVIPGLELVYVLRVDTDGSFETPRGTGRLFRMIRDARVGPGR